MRRWSILFAACAAIVLGYWICNWNSPRTAPVTSAAAEGAGRPLTRTIQDRSQSPRAQAIANSECLIKKTPSYLRGSIVEHDEVLLDETTIQKRTVLRREQAGVKYPLLLIQEKVRREGAATVENHISRSEMVVNQIVVRLKASHKGDELAELAKPLKGRIRALTSPDTYVVELPTSHLDTVPTAVALISAARDIVAYAEPDYYVHTLDTPNDTGFVQEWGLNNTGQDGGMAGADIQAPLAWTISKGNSAIKVAVIDTGIDYTHPDLAANMWNHTSSSTPGFPNDVHGWNFVANTNDPQDDNFHGTHVAGTIGAVSNNGLGTTGVSWNVTLVACKFLDANGSGATSDAVSAINYARQIPVDIMSNSWGGRTHRKH